jgi:hypothetical protein
MVASFSDHIAKEILQRSFPDRRICVHHDPNLSVRSNWIYGLLQGSGSRYQRANQELELGRGGKAVQILQQRNSPSELCAAQLCEESITMMIA